MSNHLEQFISACVSGNSSKANRIFSGLLLKKIQENIRSIKESFLNSPITAGEQDPEWQRKLLFKMRYILDCEEQLNRMSEGVQLKEDSGVMLDVQDILKHGQTGSLKLDDGSIVQMSFTDAAKTYAVYQKATASMQVKMIALLGANKGTFHQVLGMVHDLTN